MARAFFFAFPNYGLLLHKTLEKTFGQLRWCFVAIDLQYPPTYQVRLLDPDLVNDDTPLLGSNIALNALNEKEIVFNNANRPYARLLACHMQTAMRNAAACGWITQEEFHNQTAFSQISRDRSVRQAIENFRQ